MIFSFFLISFLLVLLDKEIIMDPDSKPTNKACRSANESNKVFYQTGKNEDPVQRSYVPDDKISWDELFNEYSPVYYTSPIVLAKPVWADEENFKDGDIKWNQLDNKVDRRSHLGNYEIVESLPRNPVGRTGIRGRGLLGRWGPNHAADPIVTRWKCDSSGNPVVNPITNKKILQFVAIERMDTNEWAIPGGMCDPGERVSNTMKREFMEEALNSEELGEAELEHYKVKLHDFFSKGVEVYRGYVDDPRNTDNSWMETIAYNFHDDKGDHFQNIKLNAGDDAKKVKWTDINHSLKLYASHKHFIHQTAIIRDAHW